MAPSRRPPVWPRPKRKLEGYRQGYPRLAAFLTLDRSFSLLRRFDNLHMRALLERQDRLSELESQLERCDDAEPVQLYLSSRRQNENAERKRLVEDINRELRGYDRAVLEYARMLQLPDAKLQNRQSVKRWFDGNKPIVRSESEWISDCLESDDYFSFKSDNQDTAGLESWLELALERWPSLFRTIRCSKDKTDDKHIFLYPTITLQWIAKCFAMILAPIWLIIPGVLLFTTSSKPGKVIVYTTFTLGTSFAVAFITGANKYNMIIAVVTYGAVLATFLS